jgi:hypothetical protein
MGVRFSCEGWDGEDKSDDNVRMRTRLRNSLIDRLPPQVLVPAPESTALKPTEQMKPTWPVEGYSLISGKSSAKARTKSIAHSQVRLAHRRGLAGFPVFRCPCARVQRRAN